MYRKYSSELFVEDSLEGDGQLLKEMMMMRIISKITLFGSRY